MPLKWASYQLEIRIKSATAPFKNNAVSGLWALLLLQSTHSSLLRGHPQKRPLWAGASCSADGTSRFPRVATDLLLANCSIGHWP